MVSNIIIFNNHASITARRVTWQEAKTRKRANVKKGQFAGEVIYSRRVSEALSHQLTGQPFLAKWKLNNNTGGDKPWIILENYASQADVLLQARFRPENFDWTMRDLGDKEKRALEAVKRPMVFADQDDTFKLMIIEFYPNYSVCQKCLRTISYSRVKDHICNGTRLSYLNVMNARRQNGPMDWNPTMMLSQQQELFKPAKKNGKGMKPKIFCFDLEWHSELKLIYLMCVSEYSCENDPDYKHVADYTFTITFDDLYRLAHHQPDTQTCRALRIEWLRRIVVAKFAKWLFKMGGGACSKGRRHYERAERRAQFEFQDDDDGGDGNDGDVAPEQANIDLILGDNSTSNDDDDGGGGGTDDDEDDGRPILFFVSFNGSRSDLIVMFKTLIRNLAGIDKMNMIRAGGRIVSLEIQLKHALVLFRDIILYIPAEYKGPLDAVCKSLALEQQKITLNFNPEDGTMLEDPELETKISKMSPPEKRAYKSGQMKIIDKLIEQAMLECESYPNPLGDAWSGKWIPALEKALIPYCVMDAKCCIGIFQWFTKFYTTLEEVGREFPPGERWKILFNLTNAQAAFFAFPRFLDESILKQIWVPFDYLERIQRSSIYGGKVCSALFGQKVVLDSNPNLSSKDYEILWVDIRSMYPSAGNSPMPIGKCMPTNAHMIQAIIDSKEFFSRGPTIRQFPPFIARVRVRRITPYDKANGYGDYDAANHSSHNTIHNIKSIMPPFPFRAGQSVAAVGKLRWIYNGEWEGIYNCADIYLMRREFCEIKVIDDENCLYWPDGWSRESTAKFFSKMYTIKEEATKTGDKLIQTAAKLNMNSVYGKLLQRVGTKEKIKQVSSNGALEMFQEEYGDEGAIAEDYEYGDGGGGGSGETIPEADQYGLPAEPFNFQMYESTDGKNGKPIIYGSFVLSYSRIMFNQMCNAAIYNCQEPGDIEQIYPDMVARNWGLYCDTDSIMFIRDKKYPIDAIEKMYGTAIGRWNDDTPWFTFCLAKEVLGKQCKNIKLMGVMGRKFYILGCDCEGDQHFKIKSKGHAKEEIDPKDLLNAMIMWNPFEYTDNKKLELTPTWDGGKTIGITSDLIAKQLVKQQTSRSSMKISLVKKMAYTAAIQPIFQLESTTLVRRIRMYANDHVSKCSLCEQFYYHPHFDENVTNVKRC